MCAACGYQASLTAGTIFQDTRMPLTLWFRAIWWVVSQKNGASALGLQRILGLGSYRTAWTWLHKLRRAMVRPGRDRLSEMVDVDETFVGGVELGGGRRHVGKKGLVVIAAEVRGRAIGRIRMRRVADSSAASLLPFVQEAVEPGAVVITDGLQSYRGLPALGYRHDRRVLLGSGESAEAVLPGVHRVASLLKRWLLGTHQGAVSREHLDYYLDEFTFRFNRRTSRHRGKLFLRLLEQAVAVDPVPYAAMVKGVRGLRKKARPQQVGGT
jgi:transposase-like protein